MTAMNIPIGNLYNIMLYILWADTFILQINMLIKRRQISN